MERPFVFAASMLIQQRRRTGKSLVTLLVLYFLLIPHRIGIVPGRITMVITIISCNTELPCLHRHITAAAEATHCTGIGANCSRISLQCILGCNDIDNTTNTFSIIFRSRIGNDLDILDRTCRHTFQYIGSIFTTQQVRGFAIHIDFIVRRSFQLDFVFTIHCYHRDFTEHLQRIAGFSFRVVFQAISQFIDFHLHQRLLGCYGNLF